MERAVGRGRSSGADLIIQFDSVFNAASPSAARFFCRSLKFLIKNCAYHCSQRPLHYRKSSLNTSPNGATGPRLPRQPRTLCLNVNSVMQISFPFRKDHFCMILNLRYPCDFVRDIIWLRAKMAAQALTIVGPVGVSKW